MICLNFLIFCFYSILTIFCFNIKKSFKLNKLKILNNLKNHKKK